MKLDSCGCAGQLGCLEETDIAELPEGMDGLILALCGLSGEVDGGGAQWTWKDSSEAPASWTAVHFPLTIAFAFVSLLCADFQ